MRRLTKRQAANRLAQVQSERRDARLAAVQAAHYPAPRFVNDDMGIVAALDTEAIRQWTGRNRIDDCDRMADSLIGSVDHSGLSLV